MGPILLSNFHKTVEDYKQMLIWIEDAKYLIANQNGLSFYAKIPENLLKDLINEIHEEKASESDSI